MTYRDIAGLATEYTDQLIARAQAERRKNDRTNEIFQWLPTVECVGCGKPRRLIHAKERICVKCFYAAHRAVAVQA